MGKSESENPIATFVGALIGILLAIFLGGWVLTASLLTLFGPIFPNEWKTVFAMAGLLMVSRFVLSAAKGSSKK